MKRIEFGPSVDSGYGANGGIAACPPGEVVMGVGSGNSQNNRVRCAAIKLGP